MLKRSSTSSMSKPSRNSSRAASSKFSMTTRQISANRPGTQNMGLGGGSKGRGNTGFGVKVTKKGKY